MLSLTQTHTHTNVGVQARLSPCRAQKCDDSGCVVVINTWGMSTLIGWLLPLCGMVRGGSARGRGGTDGPWSHSIISSSERLILNEQARRSKAHASGQRAQRQKQGDGGFHVPCHTTSEREQERGKGEGGKERERKKKKRKHQHSCPTCLCLIFRAIGPRKKEND